MDFIVTSILSSTVGLLCDNVRDLAAANLRGGDITDAKIREMLVRELQDIKTKLDGLSRKDLLSSYSFLQEGVDLLNVSLDKEKNEQKSEPNEFPDGRDETVSSSIESGILSEALELSHAMGKLEINSDEDFKSAKKRFEDARKKATEAFANKSLNIKDRIIAAKLRIVSEILECLENPETGITGCLSFLKELHSESDVCEIFSVYLKGGLKSKLNKEERVEIVKSVMLINYVLFQFVLKFSNKYFSPLAWPTIQLSANSSFYPVFDWQEISTNKSMGEELSQLPNKLPLDEEIDPHHSAVNSHGEIVVGRGNEIKVISKTGESKVVELPAVYSQDIVGLGVDNNNNIYVVMMLNTGTTNNDVKSYVLYVLDENYKVKCDCMTLDFLEKISSYHVWIAINRKNDIIMIKGDDTHVYVCDNTGKLKHKFERDSSLASRLAVTATNEIMIPSDDEKVVQIYTEKGHLMSSIKVPKDQVVLRVAFHYDIFKIIFLTYIKKKDSYFLLCYSDKGELETSTFFCKRNVEECIPDITSHPCGPVAVVKKGSITFI